MIEQTETGTMITGEHIGVYQWMAQIGIVGQTAQGYRKAPVQRIGAQYGSEKRTSKGILEDMVLYGYRRGMVLGDMWGTVERALGADRARKLRRKAERL